MVDLNTVICVNVYYFQDGVDGTFPIITLYGVGKKKKKFVLNPSGPAASIFFSLLDKNQKEESF